MVKERKAQRGFVTCLRSQGCTWNPDSLIPKCLLQATILSSKHVAARCLCSMEKTHKKGFTAMCGHLKGAYYVVTAYQCFQYYYPGSASHIKRLNIVGVVRISEREISQDGVLKGITPRGKGRKPLPPPCGDREPRSVADGCIP